MTEAADILRKAKELIAKKGWTKGDLARASDGRPVNPASRHATKFCAAGAIYAAGENVSGIRSAKDPLEMTLGGVLIGVWNDRPNRNKSEVLSAFDRAIALAEAGKP